MNIKRMLLAPPPLWMLVLIVVLFWGGELARRGLWEPDEARYAYVAREMREAGNWIVPHINGRLYPDKPPLMFWLINLSSLLTGGEINSISARIPSLLGSIMSLWVASRLLFRFHSTKSAWLVLPILLSTFIFWHEGGWGRIDALLCGLVMMSVYFFFTSLEEHRLRREILAYIFAGLAVFAKGPVGLVVPVGIFALCSIAGGNTAGLKRWHFLWGPALALAIPGCWLLAAWLQNAPGEYFSAMMGEKSFGRVIQSKGHDRPFYYFLWHFPIELMPWTIFLPAALTSMPKSSLKRTLIVWAVFVVCLFSLFVCKRNVYILAAYPAAAMLIAAGWQGFSTLSVRWLKITGGIAMGFVWSLTGLLAASLFVSAISFSRAIVVLPLVLLIAGGVILFRLFRREGLGYRWFSVFAACVLIFQVTISAIIMPGLNTLKGPVKAAYEVRSHLAPDEPVYLYRQQLAIFPLYSGRQGIEIDDLETLEALLFENDELTIVLFRDYEWASVAELFSGTCEANPFKLGNKGLVWVEFYSHEALCLVCRKKYLVCINSKGYASCL